MLDHAQLIRGGTTMPGLLRLQAQTHRKGILQPPNGRKHVAVLMDSFRVPGVERERLLEQIFRLNKQAAGFSRICQRAISVGVVGIEPNCLLRGCFGLLQRFYYITA